MNGHPANAAALAQVRLNASRDAYFEPGALLRDSGLTMRGSILAAAIDPDSILVRDERMRRARLRGRPNDFEDAWRGEGYGRVD